MIKREMTGKECHSTFRKGVRDVCDKYEDIGGFDDLQKEIQAGWEAVAKVFNCSFAIEREAHSRMALETLMDLSTGLNDAIDSVTSVNEDHKNYLLSFPLSNDQ